MLTVEDIAVLLGRPLNDATISAVTAVPGRELTSDHDPGHPEDERHYYVVPTLGLQLLAGTHGNISTVFFMLEGDANVHGHPWALRSGVNGASSPSAVRAQLGEPQSTGSGVKIPGLARTGSWDRFRFPPFGFLHVQYTLAGNGIAQMTLMTEAALPR